MSLLQMRPFELTITRNAGPTDTRQVPAAGATVKVAFEGATVKTAVTVLDHSTAVADSKRARRHSRNLIGQRADVCLDHRWRHARALARRCQKLAANSEPDHIEVERPEASGVEVVKIHHQLAIADQVAAHVLGMWITDQGDLTAGGKRPVF